MSWLTKIVPKPGQDRFARMMIRALRRAGLAAPLMYDAEGFRLVIEGGGERFIGLGNAYEEYCAAPILSRKRVLRRYAEFGASPPQEVPDSFEEARANLLPRVRDRFYYEAVRLQMKIGGPTIPDIPTQPIADHLAVELACDFPETVATVPRGQLEGWNVTFEEALAVARENLWKISKEPFDQPSPGLYVPRWQDNHDASRLILHDLIWQLDVKGDHVAMVPNRDMLIITGSDDDQGLQQMAAIAKDAFEDHRRSRSTRIALTTPTLSRFAISSLLQRTIRRKRCMASLLLLKAAGFGRLLTT